PPRDRAEARREASLRRLSRHPRRDRPHPDARCRSARAGAMTQRLEVFQSLWAMELRRPDGKERTPEEAFAMVAEAGFDGMAIDFGVTDMAAARKMQPLFAKHGLGCLLIAFPKTIEALRPVLEAAKDFAAPFVNVIGQVMPLSVDGMIPVIR